MKDGIINGDGTSRLARSIADFKTRYPTYDDFAAALIAGTLPLDILFNTDGWSQVPDFLNKYNLLKDATSALYGLGTDAVPDDAFQKIAANLFRKNFVGNWYWVDPINTGGQTNYTDICQGKTAITFWYGMTDWGYVSANLEIVSGGCRVYGSPLSQYPNSNGVLQTDVPQFENLVGKTATLSILVTEMNPSDGNNYPSFGAGRPGSLIKAKSITGPGLYTLSFTVTSDMKTVGISAISGTSVSSSVTISKWKLEIGDTSTLEFTEPPYNELTEDKIATGTYVGTGTYGKDNPTILTFPFKPKLLAIQNDAETNMSFNSLGAATDVIVRGVTRFPDRTYSPGSGYIEWGENTISIYSGMSALNQKNESGVTYYYVAIC